MMSIWKKKIENAMDFSARNLTRSDGSEHWSPGAYQGGFMRKKSTHGRLFIVYTTIQSAKDRGAKQWGGTLIDFTSYFDTIHPMTLQNNMKKFKFQEKIRRLTQAFKETEETQIRCGKEAGIVVKLENGATQGGAFSPYKGLIIAETMANDVQEAVKEDADIAKINDIQVPIVMYADDAVNCGEKEEANQKMFSVTEKSSNRDGTQISAVKTELIVLELKEEHEREERPAWKITTQDGNVIEDKAPEEGETEVSAKYVGVHIQSEGFSIHLKKAVRKMAASNGRLEDLVIKMWPTPMGAHRELYIAKIRSTGLFGAEVWGVENCSILNKEEPALLRTLCKSFRRPQTDMILYYLKMEKLDQIAARRAFGFHPKDRG